MVSTHVREMYTQHSHAACTSSYCTVVRAPFQAQAQTIQPPAMQSRVAITTPNTTRNTPLELQQQQHLQHPPTHSASLSHTQTEHTPLKYLQQCLAARSRPPCADRSRRASAQLQPLKHPSTSPSAPSAMLPVCSIPPDARGRLSASLAVRSSVP